MTLFRGKVLYVGIKVIEYAPKPFGFKRCKAFIIKECKPPWTYFALITNLEKVCFCLGQAEIRQGLHCAALRREKGSFAQCNLSSPSQSSSVIKVFTLERYFLYILSTQY